MRILFTEGSSAESHEAVLALRSLGHELVAAQDLVTVRQAIHSQPFDLAVLDGTMPGNEIETLTAELRRTGSSPAVVLLEKNQEAGRAPAAPLHPGSQPSVDFVLQRPLSPAVLLDLLQRAQNMMRERQQPPLLNTDELMRRFEDDHGMLVNVLEMYLEDAPARLRTVKERLTDSDGTGAIAAAHSLKGISGSVGCMPMAETAASLEKLGRSGDLATMESALPQAHALLKATLEHIRRFLTTL